MNNSTRDFIQRLLNGIGPQYNYNPNFHTNSNQHNSTALDLIIHDYNANFREYQRNIHTYQQNIRLIISELHRQNQNQNQNQNHRQTNRNTSPFNREPRRNNTPVYAGISSLLHQIPPSLFQSTTEERPPRLLHDEIENLTQIIQYTGDLGETRCPISLEDFQEGEEIVQIRRCRHIFKHRPLMIWFRNSSICPVCRRCVRDISNNDIHENIHPPIIEMDIELETETETDTYNQTHTDIESLLSLIANNRSNILSSVVDTSGNNLVYTFDIPIQRNRYR